MVMGYDSGACAARLGAAGFPAAAGDAGTMIALFAFAAGRKPDPVGAAIGASAAAHFPAYEMNTVNRIAEFVAQTAHETGGYTKFEEGLNYSAQGLANTWPSRFAVDPKAKVKGPNAQAQALARQPEAIANAVYARPEEGNVQPGDGWRYRGRGMLQLTFRDNYKRIGDRLGIDLVGHPDRAADPATSLLIALDFWKHGEVNDCCDCGDWFGARGLTNCGSRTPKVAPIGLDDVAARRARLLTVLG